MPAKKRNHPPATNKEIFVAFVLNKIEETTIKFRNSNLPLDRIVNLLGENEVMFAPLFFPHAKAVEKIAPYVPCYTIPNSIALTVAQLIQHLESVPVAKEGNPPQVMRMFLWPHLCTSKFLTQECKTLPSKLSTSKILSFVGCFCGAKNSLYYLENTDGRGSYCPNCKRYQCLRCGEDFFKEYSYARHLDRNDHKNPNLAVTTEFANRPADFPCKAPKLEDAIKIFLCHVDCEGTAKDAYKVNQYLSKCTKCEAYKCLVCGFYEFTWNNHYVKLANHACRTIQTFSLWQPIRISVSTMFYLICNIVTLHLVESLSRTKLSTKKFSE
ncbi:hypothetical protein EB796_013576 [Bugula neritina]|uniref:C2H2-type domain-containing protein n=1 Tax=Bugula neritina TaxID=10212 RepID=A0A7J7JRQ1_BUGNE|nr:hypothetical protein EB796_013576 [Bugula neritina]